MQPSPTEYRATIFLLVYRMEHTILEALESCLSQTVPCEIIVSDDASGDRGYDFALERASRYSGIHRVIVRRNPQNQGLCAHINTLAAMAVGDIFVFVAGDDISLPNRVETLLRQFDQHPDAYAVGSAVDVIDGAGNLVQRGAWYLRSPMEQRDFWLRGKFVTLLGAAMAMRRQLLIGMPPLQGLVEDNMLTLRATLFGKVYCVRDTLVKYRRHGRNHSDWIFGRDGTQEGSRRRRYERTIRMYREIADDHEKCAAALPNLPAEKLFVASQIISMYRVEADGREAVLNLPKRQWLAPIWRGLMQRGARRKSLERAFKLFVPRRWLRL